MTFFVGEVSGIFGGQPMTARLCYTRTWTHNAATGWQILAAHIAALPPTA